MPVLLDSLREHFGTLLTDINPSTPQPVIVCRRRCLKEIWCYDEEQTPYYRDTYRSPLTCHREGSLLFIEQKRMESQNATPSKMSVGRQFEEMCTVRKAGQDTTGGFTAVLHELDGIKILCFGEVDCKTDDQYIELKASASAPQYWPLSPDQRRFFFASMYLGNYELLVRGHKTKSNNPRYDGLLDKLEELKLVDLGLDEKELTGILQERLEFILERVEGEDKFSISYNDETGSVEVTPLAST